jgi:hypothetical protein
MASGGQARYTAAMKALRRHASLLGIVIAWVICLGSLLGGLSLARALPEAHARALAHNALCLPGDQTVPADQAGHQHGAGCLLCPAPTGAPQLAAAPSAILADEVTRAHAPLRFAVLTGAPQVAKLHGAAQARAPPRI